MERNSALAPPIDCRLQLKSARKKGNKLCNHFSRINKQNFDGDKYEKKIISKIKRLRQTCMS